MEQEFNVKAIGKTVIDMNVTVTVDKDIELRVCKVKNVLFQMLLEQDFDVDAITIG